MLQTLTRKVTLMAVLILGLFVIAAVITSANILVLRNVATYLGDTTITQVEFSGQFNTDMFRGFAEALAYAHTRQPDNRDSARQEMRDAQALLDQLAVFEGHPDPYAPELVTARAQLQQRRVTVYNQLQPQIEELLGAVESNDTARISSALNVLNAHKAEVEQLEEDSGTHADQSIAAATNAAASRVLTAIISTGVSFGVLVLLIPGILILLHRWIVQPVKGVAAAAKRVALGSLDHSLAITSDDEIGDLQRAFNQMVEHLAAGHETVAEQQGALSAQTADLERTVTELRESISAREQLSTAVRELASPVVPVLKGILVMPLIGMIDTARAAILLAALLTAIERHAAHMVIVDVTGVPLIDAQVAAVLLQAIEGAELLGAQTILVGIRPELAQTIVSLGANLAHVVTRADLQSAVSYAMQLKHIKL
jgi:anti-anti-sigma regulatory factor/HAMP domain-containing protein